jgi:hypothetical protein
MRETQELERLRLAQTPLLAVPGGEPSELDQPRLLGVQLHPEPREPVTQLSLEPFSVLPMLKRHHGVVSEPHDDNITASLPASPLVRPQVKDVVRVDVGKQRRSGSSI